MKRAPAVCLRGPDVSTVNVVCGKPAPAARTWVQVSTTCRGCLNRLAKRPQLANAIHAARQLTIDEALSSEAASS